MLNPKKTPLPPPPIPADTLYDRISALYDECDAYLDAEAAKEGGKGIPVGVIRMMLTAKAGHNVFFAAQMNLDSKRFEAEMHEKRLARLRG